MITPSYLRNGLVVNTKKKSVELILLCLVVWVALFLSQTQFMTLSQVSTQTSRTISEDQHKVVLLIHYHKTGSFFITDLIQNLDETFQKNLHDIRVADKKISSKTERKAVHDSHQRNNTPSHQKRIHEIRRQIITSMRRSHNITRISHNRTTLDSPVKRSHNKTTGCPIMGNNSYDKDTVRRVTAPDFFCNLLQESQLPPPKDTKIVHFVRDPIEMALSNYLYHSQYPTPEAWVRRKNFDPCEHDPSFFQYVLEELKVVTVEEINKVQSMCRSYRFSGSRNNRPRAFYALLRQLPTFDGLRMATTQFIIANNVESGADLLRMPNNIQRLQAWEGGDHHQSILTVSMDQLIGDMKNTIINITNFIFSHNQNDTARLLIADTISGKMVKAYKDKKLAAKKLATTNYTQTIRRGNAMKRNNLTNSHVMQGVLNKTERQILKRRLEEDEVLGPILLKMRAIVNAVLG
jgi:hypothetical protein